MRNKEGLTIIECLISIIILAIMLTAGMAFYFNAQASMRWAIHKRIAVEMASAELEKIKNSGYWCLPEPAPGADGLWTIPDCNGQVHTKSVSIGSLTVQGQQKVYIHDIDEGAVGTDYKQVRVEISWPDAGKSSGSTVVLDTYMAP